MTKFYNVHDYFLRSYEAAKFRVIFELYLDVSGVILANDHTQYANSGLDVNFWNDKRGSFKQKL